MNGKELKPRFEQLDPKEGVESINFNQDSKGVLHDLHCYKLYHDIGEAIPETELNAVDWDLEYGLPITNWNGNIPGFSPPDKGTMGDLDVLAVDMNDSGYWPELYHIEVKLNPSEGAKEKAKQQLGKSQLLPFDVKGKLMYGDEIMEVEPKEVEDWNFSKEFENYSYDGELSHAQNHYLNRAAWGDTHGRYSVVGHPLHQT